MNEPEPLAPPTPEPPLAEGLRPPSRRGGASFARAALAALALALGGGLIYLAVSADGFIRRSELEKEKQKLEEEIAVLRDENQLLRQKMDRLLHDPGYVEDEARKKLGLIRPGETVYRLSEEPDLTAAPAESSGGRP